MSTFQICKSLLAFNLLLPALAVASAEAHSDAAHLIPFWINFMVYLVLMYLLTRKPILAAWATRRANIEEAVGGGKREVEAAQAKLDQARSKLAGIAQEALSLKNEVERDTKRECEELLKSAQIKAARITARAKEGARAEQKVAESKLQKEIAELAFKLAREKLSKGITIEKDKAFREASIGSIKSLVQ